MSENWIRSTGGLRHSFLQITQIALIPSFKGHPRHVGINVEANNLLLYY